MVPIEITAFGLLAVCVILLAVVLAVQLLLPRPAPPRPGPDAARIGRGGDRGDLRLGHDADAVELLRRTDGAAQTQGRRRAMGRVEHQQGPIDAKAQGTLHPSRLRLPAVCRPIVASLLESTLASPAALEPGPHPPREHRSPPVEAVERDQEEKSFLARLVQQIVVVDMKRKSRPPAPGPCHRDIRARLERGPPQEPMPQKGDLPRNRRARVETRHRHDHIAKHLRGILPR